MQPLHLQVGERLDVLHVTDLLQQIELGLGNPHIIMDMKELIKIDTMGLQALLMIKQYCVDNAIKLEFIDMPDKVRGMIEMLNLDGDLPMKDTGS